MACMTKVETLDQDHINVTSLFVMFQMPLELILI